MKTIDIGEASDTLTEYLKQARTEPVVFTDKGTPTAVILTLANADLETVALSTNPEFIALIERSRASQGGGRDLCRRDAPACSAIGLGAVSRLAF